MNVHSLYAALQRVAPRPAASYIRKFGTAVLTPLRFSIRTGHFRSSLAAVSYNRSGNPIPWYTYPAIDLLSQKSFENCSVLEFGAGQSTLWWAKRARTVVSYESNKEWHDRLKPELSSNVRLVLSPESPVVTSDEKYDIIIVDGLDRLQASKIAIDRLAERGAIIIDNSEGYWGADGTYPIMDALRNSRFQRVDFHGFAPGVINRQCTSIAFRDSTFLFDGFEPPLRLD